MMGAASTSFDARPALGAADDAGFGIYFHWPFCLSKCPYCDFNSHVRERIDQSRWLKALLRELDHYAGLTPGRSVTSIFFGGGTPSLMAPETVDAIIRATGRHWRLDDRTEITLEVNPTSAEAARFAAFAEAGVNRVSLGVQSLDDNQLRFLGRNHTSREALAAVGLAHLHFKRVNFDLIYARPGQTSEAWREELCSALDHVGGHVSLYQLTIEPGTRFEHAVARGDFAMPEEAIAAELYELTQEMLEAAGLPAYEISNHARSGDESRHNLIYWRYGDYAGIGPGAHGRLTIGGRKFATRQHRAPERWLEAVERAGHATRQHTALTQEERFEEMLIMGLRLREGVSRERVRQEIGKPIEALLDAGRVATLIDSGFLVLDDCSLRATKGGRQRLNTVLAWLVG